MADLFLQEEVLKKDLVFESSSSLKDEFLAEGLKPKELVPQIDWVITQRKLDYLSHLLLLSKHKSVQVRRKVATGLGLLGSSSVLQNLKQWQVQESDRQTWLIIDSAIDKIQRKNDGQNLQQAVHILTVSEALDQVKRLVSEKTYIIEGELSDIRPISQMYYFALKDSQDSRLDCSSFVGKIVQAGFPLNEGLSVRIRGKFKIGKFSKLYLDVEKIELTGEGELLRNLKLLEEKLTKEGLFEPARKRKIKKIPKNILLIASGNSAALTDFTKILNNRIGGLNIYHLPIKTQGVGAEFEIIESLKLANLLAEKYQIDTVVLTRGGGSKDDLFVFNTENVVRAIQGLNRPSIVAIGHERDLSLAEMVADLRASTPSQAAELISLSRNEILQTTQSLNNFAKSYFFERKDRYKAASLLLYNNLLKLFQIKLLEAQKICAATSRLATGLIYQLKNLTKQTWQSALNISKIQLVNYKNSVNKVDYLQKGLLVEVERKDYLNKKLYQIIHGYISQNLQIMKNNFEINIQKIDLNNPKLVLQKGYAIIHQNKKIVSLEIEFETKKPFQIEFLDKKVDIN